MGRNPKEVGGSHRWDDRDIPCRLGDWGGLVLRMETSCRLLMEGPVAPLRTSDFTRHKELYGFRERVMCNLFCSFQVMLSARGLWVRKLEGANKGGR